VFGDKVKVLRSEEGLKAMGSGPSVQHREEFELFGLTFCYFHWEGYLMAKFLLCSESCIEAEFLMLILEELLEKHAVQLGILNKILSKQHVKKINTCFRGNLK
jgi:hypothetical protein